MSKAFYLSHTPLSDVRRSLIVPGIRLLLSNLQKKRYLFRATLLLYFNHCELFSILRAAVRGFAAAK